VSAPDIHAIAARHVHGLPHNWQPRTYSALDRCLGYELRGSVPIGTYSRGPRKGRPKWPRLAELQRVVITMDEVRQARIRWENETGLCSHCGGSGQQVKSTGISGTTYRECISCDGTGRALRALHRRAEVEA
jgi:hypothetical protein